MKPEEVNTIMKEIISDDEKVRLSNDKFISEKNNLSDDQKTMFKKHMNEIEEKWKSYKIFIIVGGETSSGKTTFLNSLFGCELLPTSIHENTSSIVLIECN